MRLLLPRAGDLSDPDLDALYAVEDRSRPVLRMNFVTSADGAVTVGGYSAGLSGGADKRVFALLRDDCDALMVGAGTFRHEGYRELALPPDRVAKRLRNGLAGQPVLVIVSGRLALRPDHPAFVDAPVRPIVLCHARSPADRRAELSEVADVLVHGDTEVDLRAGIAELAARGLTQVLCEGGPHLFGALLAADAVDELCLTVAPLLPGPGAGRIVAGGPVAVPVGLSLRHVLEADGNLLLRYASSHEVR
jgi:riboflavin biosynthesis pyrimidine reductase